MNCENKVAILITCHNRREKTLSCLNAIFNAKLPDHHTIEVFLVDDGSSDRTGEAVRENFPQVNIIQGTGELYWTRGMHLAWETASKSKDFDFYLWLNDDTYIFPNALEILVRTSGQKENKSIIVAASVSHKNGEMTYSGFGSNGKIIYPAATLLQASTFNGNCVLIPKYVYNTVGNLDPLFCHCIGDTDYGLRALKKGIKSFVAPVFLAYCESHEKLPDWCIKELPFSVRIRSLYSHLGNNHPYYYFRFELRHFGIKIAIKHLISMHLRVISPELWSNMKQ